MQSEGKLSLAKAAKEVKKESKRLGRAETPNGETMTPPPNLFPSRDPFPF